MSRKRKNFHYHYAEQFETREQRLARRRSKRRFAVPPLALVFSIVLLAVFGLVSTTFSVYVTTSFDDPEMPAQGGLVVNVKNNASSDHPESTGIVRNNGEDLADSGANMDLAESGASITSDGNAILFINMNAVSWWIADSGNQNFAYFYGTSGSAWSAHSVQQTGNYYYFKIPSGTWDHVILTRNNTTTSPSWDNKWNQTGDIELQSGKNYISAFSENSASATFGTYQLTSTASLSASPTSILTSQTSTLTPSLSSNTTYNEIKSTSYSVTRNSGSGTGSVTNGVFSATGAGTYTVTATVTYNAKGFSGITKSATATKQITVTAPSYCTMSVDASKSLTLGTATALKFTTTNHSSGSVKITSADSTYVQVSSSSGGTYGTTATISGVSGTFYLKGLKPTSSPINVIVSCNAGHSNAVPATCAVTVKTPTVTFDSLSVEELRSGTLSITGRTPAPTSYSWSVDNTYSSLISLSNQTATSVKVTAAAYSQATAKVKYTAAYSTGYSKTFEATVSLTESTLSLRGSFDNWSEAGQKMTYDSAANSSYGTYTNRGNNLYTCSLSLAGGTTYDFGINEGNSFYAKNVTIGDTRSNCKIEVSSNNDGLDFATGLSYGTNCHITTGASGTYTFYYNPTNHRLWVSEYPGIEYYLLGFGDWSKSASQKMTETSSGSGVYTFTKSFTAAQSYAAGSASTGFKVWCNDEKYYGKSSTTITRTAPSATLTNNNADSYNLGIKATYSGDYLFTYNSSTKELTVTYPTRSITVNAKLNDSNTILGSISNSNTSSNFFTITDNYNDTFTVTPKTNHTQYQFTKWRDNNSTTRARTITVNSSTAVTYDTNWNYKSYTITYNTNGGTLASGSYTSVTTPNSVYKSSYTYGTGKTLPTASDITHATAPSLYSFGGWYTSSGFTGNAVTSIGTSESGNKTYYAKWNMEVVFKNNITDETIDTQTVADGSTASAPDLTDENADMSDLGFEFSGYSTPLTTAINYSWYHSNGDSNVIYVNYIPKSREFSITITPDENVTVDTTGTYDHYTIPFGASIAAHAEVTVPTGYDEDIYIKWFATINGVDYDADYYGDYSDTDPPTYYDDENGKYVFDRADIVTLLTKVAPAGTYTLKAKAYYDIDGSTTVVSENYVSHTITYQVDSPMAGVTKTPDQKIYTVESAPDVVASISTHSSISDTYIDLLTDYYKVAAMVYDKNHSTTDKYDEIDGYEELDIEGDHSPFTATFDGVSLGVNYYKFKLKRLEDIDDPTSDLVDDSVSSSTRTVVGTNQGAASRPIYVANNSGNAFTGKRVMLFYTTDRGTLGYASSTTFNHATAAGGNSDKEVYRFDIPNYVESVSIGVFDSSKEYALPTLSGTTLSYTGTNFFTWSNWKEIDSSVQKINISGITANGQIADSKITTGLLS